MKLLADIGNSQIKIAETTNQLQKIEKQKEYT